MLFLTTVVIVKYFFFFSSRRRHTRFSRDWSSDVCSSDLQRRHRLVVRLRSDRAQRGHGPGRGHDPRSEERRVGKECRSRWLPYPEKKKHTVVWATESNSYLMEASTLVLLLTLCR